MTDSNAIDRSFAALVRELPASTPFVGPEAQERARGAAFRARLGANESVFGPSPAVKAAIAAAAEGAWMYGDPENYELRAALAAHHGCAMENVLVGEGIDGLLGLTARLFLDPGDAVVTSLGAYPTFNYHVAAVGGRIQAIPYRNNAPDVFGLAEKARSCSAKLVYLSNPDNPTGWVEGEGGLARFIAELPAQTTFCLDEAYIVCAPDDPPLPFDFGNPRILRFRTFSKAYGLAGMRVGYVLGAAEVIKAFDKIRNHFGVGRVAQAAALAALQDQDHLRKVVQRIIECRNRIYYIAKAAGMTPVASGGELYAH